MSLILLSALALHASAISTSTTHLTLFNNNFAYVQEQRAVDLSGGKQTLTFSNLPSTSLANSFSIQDLDHPDGFHIDSLNTLFGGLDPLSLLRASVGKEITIVEAQGSVHGTLVRAPDGIGPAGNGMTSFSGMVLKTADGHIVLDPQGTLTLDGLPPLADGHTSLQAKIDASTTGKDHLLMGYLVNGISCSPTYVINLQETPTAGELHGYLNLSNSTDVDLTNAEVRFLAGKISVPQQMIMNDGAVRTGLGGGGFGGGGFEAAKMQLPVPSVGSDSGNYHFYQLTKPVTVGAHESTQVNFVEADDLTYAKTQELNGQTPSSISGEVQSPMELAPHLKAVVYLQFKNVKNKNLGTRLPAGGVVVYQRNTERLNTYLGSGSIPEMDKDGDVRLALGDSYDVYEQRTLLSRKPFAGNLFEEAFQLQIHNDGDLPEDVIVIENHSGDWKVTAATEPRTDANGSNITFKLHMLPHTLKEIRYTLLTPEQ